MTSVFQDILEPPDGNCFAACIASLLNLSLSDVPNPHGKGWWAEWQTWLHPRGLYAVCFPYSIDGRSPSWGYWLGNPVSPRLSQTDKRVDHCVVMYEHELVHDPHPLSLRTPEDVADLATIDEAIVLVPLDPATVRL